MVLKIVDSYSYVHTWLPRFIWVWVVIHYFPTNYIVRISWTSKLFIMVESSVSVIINLCQGCSTVAQSCCKHCLDESCVLGIWKHCCHSWWGWVERWSSKLPLMLDPTAEGGVGSGFKVEPLQLGEACACELNTCPLKCNRKRDCTTSLSWSMVYLACA